MNYDNIDNDNVGEKIMTMMVAMPMTMTMMRVMVMMMMMMVHSDKWVCVKARFFVHVPAFLTLQVELAPTSKQ